MTLSLHHDPRHELDHDLDVVGDDTPVRLTTGETVRFAHLDHAASAPCVRAAADAVRDLLPFAGSVHRGTGLRSQTSTLEYERARDLVASFAGARTGDSVVFTRNTTDALNLLARALPPGTTTVVFDGEHHANLLPWPRQLRLPCPDSPDAAVAALHGALRTVRGPALLAVTGASNVTGEVWPVRRLADVAHAYGARVVVDAAQLAPHSPVDLTALGADYLAFSGHKLYAPFGAGVLAGRADWLDAAPPYLAGAARVAWWATAPARSPGSAARHGTRAGPPTCSARSPSAPCARRWAGPTVRRCTPASRSCWPACARASPGCPEPSRSARSAAPYRSSGSCRSPWTATTPPRWRHTSRTATGSAYARASSAPTR
ncbi:hypothetical protein Asp14428_05540 [Actinoplanes sp. NBRC 14428]|nr:hypothetical protein Asp14428_05540 [Actinoplanes sp. NBRC 14428]